ncbi:hypothetical protein HanIR_Chr11g0522511 [Helianthus annuus]|nr:hypothetical protein HanIR_Chr11g0522511 [Helianthus annuus]
MVYQMAQRGGECFLVRRVADRGIDKSIGDSRVRGDRLNCDSRSAGRGNEISYRDPRDIIKIEKLRKRVRDLEEIRRLCQRVRDLEEIRRLRQRVRDLELQRERRVMETESGPIVRDDVNEEEENPFGRYPPRFYEPVYQENLSEEEPRFDEDRIEFDEEECSLVQTILSGITSRDDEAVKKINDHDYVKVSAAKVLMILLLVKTLLLVVMRHITWWLRMVRRIWNLHYLGLQVRMVIMEKWKRYGFLEIRVIYPVMRYA